MSNAGMSIDMYNFISSNLENINYDIIEGIITTPKGTNGTICSSTGYLRVKVKKKLLQVHQVLGVIYFGSKCIGMQINHIDGNKLNNKISNLEAITQAENLKHQKENGLLGKKSNQRSVDKLDLDGNYMSSYPSMAEASKKNNIKSPSTILYAVRGIDWRGDTRKTAGGFKWRYSS